MAGPGNAQAAREAHQAHPNGQHLLLIGAYRDNEVSSHHPLMLTLSTIRKTNAMVREIQLEPLSPGDVNQLLSDALRCELAQGKAAGDAGAREDRGQPFLCRSVSHQPCRGASFGVRGAGGRVAMGSRSHSGQGLHRQRGGSHDRKLRRLAGQTQKA